MTRNVGRLFLIAASAVLAAGALAQTKIGSAPGAAAQQNTPAPVLLAAPNEATLRQELDRAKKQIADLTKSLTDCQKTRDAALAKANVKMFCADRVTSKNSLGARESCVPFACSAVSGLCFKRCATAEDCASGYACDHDTSTCQSR